MSKIDTTVLDAIIANYITQTRVTSWNNTNAQDLTLAQAQNIVRTILNLNGMQDAIRQRQQVERQITSLREAIQVFETEYLAANPLIQTSAEQTAINDAQTALGAFD